MLARTPLPSINLQPRDSGLLERIVGNPGEIFYNRDTRSLRVYDGRTAGGKEMAATDFSNVPDALFLQKGEVLRNGLVLTTLTNLENSVLKAKGVAADLAAIELDNVGNQVFYNKAMASDVTGAIRMIENEINSDDSTTINFLPRVAFNSDVDIGSTLHVNEITSQDSGEIKVYPKVYFYSDVTVENELTVNKITNNDSSNLLIDPTVEFLKDAVFRQAIFVDENIIVTQRVEAERFIGRFFGPSNYAVAWSMFMFSSGS